MVGRKRGFRKSSISAWQAAVTADFSVAENSVDLIVLAYAASTRIGMGFLQLRQKLVEPVDGVIVDAREHVGEPCLWIESWSFAVMISVAMTAARSAPRSEPANNHDFLPGQSRAARVRLHCW